MSLAIKRIGVFVCVLMLIQAVFSSFMIVVPKALAQSATVSVKVKFQPAASSIPAGYIADSGELHRDHDGLRYGWNLDHTDATVSRSTYQAPEVDSFVRMHTGGIWEMDLPSGSYNVTVSVGDAVYASTNTLFIEGMNVWNAALLPAGQHAVQTKTVQVTDGKLTLGEGGAAEQVGTALNYIEIIQLTSAPAPIPTPVPVTRMTYAPVDSTTPQIAPPPEPRTIAGNKVLISGNMINEHNAPAFMHLDGLQPEIDRYMNEQIQSVKQSLTEYELAAEDCSHCDASEIRQKIIGSHRSPVIVKTGHLNVDASVVFGSPTQPVVVMVSGLNVNRNATIDVYGILIVDGNVNANADLILNAYAPGGQDGYGHLWVTGALHLKDNSSLHLANQLYAGSLKFNNGSPSVQAKRILIEDTMHINTSAVMNAQEELALGELISNNQTANLTVTRGDFFIRGDVSVNNNLTIRTGGVFAVGGNMTANQKPFIATGFGGQGETLLKYTLHGLKAEYFNGTNLSGPSSIRLDSMVQLQPSTILTPVGIASNQFSVRWTGQIEPRYSEAYVFDLDAAGGVRLWVNNELLIDAWAQYANTASRSIVLEAGKRYDIRLEYSSNTGGKKANLYWTSAAQLRERVPHSQLYPISTVIQPTATETGITLNWPITNANGYDIVVDGTAFTLPATTVYEHTDLAPGTEHTYQLKGHFDDMIGEWSPVLRYWTLPAIPQSIQVASTSNSVTLEWDPVTGATGYEIQAYDTIIDNGASTRYVDAGINPNTQHTYRVRAKNSSGSGKWSELIVKTALPGVPANLRGTAYDTSISVEWDPVSGSIGYDLEINGIVVSNLATARYTHAAVQPSSSHTYRVRASNADGNSEWSRAVRIVSLPTTPAQLAGVASSSSITVSWAPSAGASSYDLEIDGAVVGNGLITSYTHSGLIAGSEHSYRVRARNVSTAGHWSSLIQVRTLLTVPSNVQLTVPSSTEILVTWDAVVGTLSYEIEVDGQVLPNGLNTVYLHSGLTPFTQHSYRIRAVNAGGPGDWTELYTRTTGLGQPLNLTAVMSPTSILLSWDAVHGADGYDVLVDGVLIDNGASTSYEHAGLAPNTRHLYRVRAKSGSLSGDWSETLSRVTALGTPAIIDVKASSTQISLTWSEVNGAAAYDVEADGIVLDSGTSSTFTHAGLYPNTTHTYRIRAKNGDAYGEWSEGSQWSTLVVLATPPGIPINFEAVPDTNSIRLTWSPVLGARLYDVEVDGIVLSSLANSQYLHEGLDPNTMHIYRVRAVGDGGKSGWTSPLQVRTTPELTVNVGKDTIFNFVVVVPQKAGMSERRIKVVYNPADIEALDLSAITPASELATGPIAGTNLIVMAFRPGTIEYVVRNAEKTVTNTIRFQAKTNEYSKISYTIE